MDKDTKAYGFSAVMFPRGARLFYPSFKNTHPMSTVFEVQGPPGPTHSYNINIVRDSYF